MPNGIAHEFAVALNEAYDYSKYDPMECAIKAQYLGYVRRYAHGWEKEAVQAELDVINRALRLADDSGIPKAPDLELYRLAQLVLRWANWLRPASQ